MLKKKYNRLTPIKLVRKNKNYQQIWLFKCDCGNIKEIRLSVVKSGHTKSCGCYNIEICKLGLNKITHNLSKSRLYDVWTNMKQRCYNKNNPYYKNYGARGIQICNEWLNNFQSFYNWAIQNNYKSNLQIDRINNDGNYTPDNCRFITHKENQNNRRNSRSVLKC